MRLHVAAPRFAWDLIIIPENDLASEGYAISLRISLLNDKEDSPSNLTGTVRNFFSHIFINVILNIILSWPSSASAADATTNRIIDV